MKKILFLLSALILFSCDDGDLEVEELDFNPDSVENCDDDTSVLFIINGDEAIILTLDAGLLINETTVLDEPREGTITANDFDVNIRIFSGTVSNTYFCSAVPLTEPSVISELNALSGTIEVTTTQNETNPLQFDHEIRFKSVVFENDGNGERLIDSDYLFGNFSTTAPETTTTKN
ncbi:hypothetical protein [Spongiivirga citrea]|uniref:Uncharacterized protein n=1 Tax=Spongiivirga citrea TaxID=1481457 RepID=A0A6M0CLP1_9FLAO|nr:hypothetical protein [Spongiivirga citrea]NER16327.1 hypothetical protein [Spongiivirga citrea]